MVAPTLTSDHPGLEVLAEVARVLAANRPVHEKLTGVVGAHRPGLGRRRCRACLRTPDGGHYRPITSPQAEAHLPGFPVDGARWAIDGPHREELPGGALLRPPLAHDDAPLGCFEVIIPQGRHER